MQRLTIFTKVAGLCKETEKKSFSGRLLILMVLMSFFVLATLTDALPAETQPFETMVHPVYRDHSFPESVTLCGEPMPLEDRRVWEMLDREFTIAVWRPGQVFLWLKRAGRYFPYIEKKLAEQGMPDDLKYLAVAESDLLSHARSRAGAVGPWQFMPRTARNKGLRKDHRIDERRNFESSTAAALRYLKELKDQFGSWTLAMAGYNCGENRLGKEIEEQKVNDYYRLNLPMETERYIFRIAAIKIIMEHPERYGYYLPSESRYPSIESDRVAVRVSKLIHIREVADALKTDFNTIKKLNPHILGHYLPTGRYTVKVPPGTKSSLMAFLEDLSRSVASSKNYNKRHHIVQPGDTLSKIAQMSGVPMHTLRQINGISGSLIKVGQKLRLK
jgi:hypothetical protein